MTTLWCGDPDQRATVLDQLDRMVLHDTDPVAPLASVFGGDLTDGEADAWRQRIGRLPHRYAAQEKAVFAPAAGGVARSPWRGGADGLDSADVPGRCACRDPRLPRL